MVVQFLGSAPRTDSIGTGKRFVTPQTSRGADPANSNYPTGPISRRDELIRLWIVRLLRRAVPLDFMTQPNRQNTGQADFSEVAAKIEVA